MSGGAPGQAGLGGPGSAGATSGLASRPAALIVLGLATLGLPSTSSHGEQRLLVDAVVLYAQATSGGGAMHPPAVAAAVAEVERARDAVTALRRVSGLTWDQVARLFGVSRRSVHFWASGAPMSAAHEEHLHRLVALLRGLDAPADAVRSALLSVEGGAPLLEALAGRRYAAVEGALRAVAGSNAGRPPNPRTPLSAAAAAARRPLPVAVLAAPEAPVNPTTEGRGRPARTARSTGRGQS